MNDDFSKRVRQYLTDAQREAWDKHLAAKPASSPSTSSTSATAGTKEQVQQIRINNNPFSTENQFFGNAGSGGSYGFSGGVGTEIFQRGGTGAFHGSYEFRFRDESLNARNAFSPTRPPTSNATSTSTQAGRSFRIDSLPASAEVRRNRTTSARSRRKPLPGRLNSASPGRMSREARMPAARTKSRPPSRCTSTSTME